MGYKKEGCKNQLFNEIIKAKFIKNVKK